MPLAIVDRLRAEVLQDPAAEHEIGGLLIGNPTATPGDVEIVDFFPLPPESAAAAKNFTIRPDSLAQAARTCAAVQRRVVGFYRSHLGSRIHLRPDDLELIHKYFKDPADVFLVIRPHDGQASAGFFFWQGDTVFGDFSLNFPLSAADLKSRAWATLVGGAPAQRRPPSVLYRTLSRALQVATQTRVLLICCIIALVAAIGGLLLREGSLPTLRPRTAPDSSHTLGLHVERDGVNLLIRWDRSAPEIANARDANLLIWDGSTQPLFVQLNPAQLRTGSVSYTSANERVEFRLDVIGPSGNARTESTVSIAGSPYVRAPAPDLGMPSGDAGQRRQTAAPLSLPLPSFVKPAPATQPPVAVAKNSPPKPEPRLFSPEASVPATPAVSTPELVVPADVHVAANQAPPPSAALAVEHAAAPPPPSKPASAQPQSQPTTPNLGLATPATPPKVGGSFVPAKAIREQPPVVPPEMKFLIRSDTTIEIQVHIDETGKVVSAKVLSKTGMFLARPALEAAQRWQFAPARLNNKPVSSDKVLQFVFRTPSH